MKLHLTLIFTLFSFWVSGQDQTYKKVIFYDEAETSLSISNSTELQNWRNQWLGSSRISVQISGYADTTGNISLNLQYSKLRALGVYGFLISLGVDKDAISVDYHGEVNGVFPNSDPIDLSKNRCVIITVKPNPVTQKKLLVKGNSKGGVKSDLDIAYFENDSSISFNNGTILEIPGGTFYPIKISEIAFEVDEIFTLCDMLENNTTTRATNGDCLISAGMIYVKAVYDGVEIQPNKKKYIRIKLPAQSESLDKEMAVYGKYRNSEGEIIWDKIESALSYDSLGARYYLFDTDTLYGFNLDKPIGVICDKSGPIVKVPKLIDTYIVQLYPNEKYLSVPQEQTKTTFKLDELRYDKEPYLVILAKDKNGAMYLAEGSISKLKYRKLRKRFIVKKKYFKKLAPDFTETGNVQGYLCEYLN